MEAFCGKWELTNDIRNLDNFLRAINCTEMKAKFTKPYIYEASFENDVFRSVLRIEGEAPTTMTAKLGEKTKTSTPYTGEIQSTVTMEGKEMVVEQELPTHNQTARSRVEGSKLIVDTTANGVTYTRVLARML